MNFRKHLEEYEITTSAKMLINRAKKGNFAEWIASNPKALAKVYGGKIPKASAILSDASKGQIKALNALEHWEGEAQWKKWKKERWGE